MGEATILGDQIPPVELNLLKMDTDSLPSFTRTRYHSHFKLKDKDVLIIELPDGRVVLL